jgi:hypothetical protein
MRRFAFLLLLLPLGCGSVNPGKTGDPVEIEGRVAIKGQAVDGLTFNLQPTGDGTPMTLPVKKGAVKGTVTPGKYTYFLSEGPARSAFAAVPAKYRAGSMDRQIEIKAAGSVELAFVD